MSFNFIWTCSPDTDIRYLRKRYVFFAPDCDDASEFYVANTLTGACVQYCKCHNVSYDAALDVFRCGGCKVEWFDVTECEEVK